MPPILLQDLTIHKTRDHYEVSLRAVGQEPIDVETDGNLGHLMSGLSLAFKTIQQQVTGAIPTETRLLTGSINLTTLRVEPLTVWPYRWRLVLATETHSFTCNLDNSLESVIAGFSAAMKFFGQHEGLVDVFDEVTYNHDRAGEAGLLEGHT